MPAKYSDHPLFHLRVLLIVSAVVGILLGFCAPSGPFLFSCFLLFLTGILAWFDLMAYKIAKATYPDHNPQWPQGRYLVGDAIFAIVLQWLFWPLVAGVTMSYYNSTVVLEAYAALPVLVSAYVGALSVCLETDI